MADAGARQLTVAAARRLIPAAGGNPALDRLAALAARLLGSASSQVSLIADRQSITGGFGLLPGAVGSHSDPAESLCRVTVEAGEPLIVSDAGLDDRVRSLGPVRTGAVGSYLGVPLHGDDGSPVGALCVFDPTPREWSPSDVGLLQQIAASAVAELELSALSVEYEAGRVFWELAIRAAGIGTFSRDLATGVLTWDDRLIDLFGYDEETFDRGIESFYARMHPEDVTLVTAALESAVESRGEFSMEYRLLLPDGALRWMAARGRVISDDTGNPVRVLGAAYDTTTVRQSEARVAGVLEAMATAFFSLDADWRFTYVNGEAEKLLGRPRTELVGGVIWELFPAAVGSDFEVNYRSAMSERRSLSFDAYYPAPLDAWFEVRASSTSDGLSVYFLDITARRAAQEQAERAALRASLLVEVTEELTSTLDPAVAVARLAQLVVPALADWCIVSLVEDDHGDWRRGLRDVGHAHAEPHLARVVEAYCAVRAAALTDDSFVARALRSGRPVVIRSGALDAVSDVLTAGVARDLLHELAPDSIAVLPLRGRGRTVGLLSTFNSAARGRPSLEDLTTLNEVTARAGLALDNVRLYAQQRNLAEGLQRSLLTAPPEPDHVQVVVRYEPATEAAQVGGDWYDAFLQPDGATMLVIGDVVGHDTAAAAAMGQVRGLLRGIAAHTGEGPAAVLRGVDQVIETLQMDTTATVVVARLEQTLEERERGITQIRWSNAGHPPPMVINPDGTVTILAGVEADLLLGIEPRSQRVESKLTVDRDTTMLLYTDGLVERRGQNLDEGLARLRDTLAELVDLELSELCDEVLVRMLPERPEDDVALVAVRLHRQDRPRPREAGPQRVPRNLSPEPEIG